MYKKFHLKNNIPVVTVNTKDVRSICLGIWVKVGSRYENQEENGVSHFLEHMFFKGTDNLTAKDIAIEIDSMGGELNAFTSCECTTFYIKTLDEHMEKAVKLLTDIFLDSTFPESDIEKEKSIIAEEIKMVEDTPSDYVHDLFSNDTWGESGLGHSVLGTQETIGKFTKGDLLRHINRFYGTDNIIVACSGNFNDEKLISLLNQSLGCLDRSGKSKNISTPEFISRLNVIPKELSESHICLGLKSIPYGSNYRYTMYLLNTMLGSGFSSRLFQEIREKRGLAYSIYSFNLSYTDTGLWGVYAGTDKANVKEVIDVTVSEIKSLSTSITEDELQRAKDQLKGNLILALESTSNRMANLAKQEIYFSRYFSPEEVMMAVDSVTLEDVKNLSQSLSGEKPFALTLYGPVREGDMEAIKKIISITP
jgi:predicted Zn-dependent peptidase